jgi:hypothetical protein
MFELLSDVRVGVDFFEGFVLLQAKEFSELIESTTVPVRIEISF